MIQIHNLTKTFHTASGTVEALKNVSFTIPDGAIFGVIGMSGAGKSTLVRCMNMLERPTEGEVIIDGVDIGALSPKKLREKRREITMIFQGFNLLMQRNCLSNVRFPLELEGKLSKEEANKRAMELLDIVGLSSKAKAYPAQLSGGQQQRVAIARALATNPKVLLCDEATSALDPSTTASILELIKDINRKMGITAVIITHQMSVVESTCDHVAIIDNGSIAEIGPVSEVFAHPKSAAAKRLVMPDKDETNILVSSTDKYTLRVVFNGAKSTGTPLIAHMAVEKGIEANIVYASMKNIGDKVYGSMVLGINGDENTVKEAVAYLSSAEDVVVEEVKADDSV